VSIIVFLRRVLFLLFIALAGLAARGGEFVVAIWRFILRPVHHEGRTSHTFFPDLRVSRPTYINPFGEPFPLLKSRMEFDHDVTRMLGASTT